MTQHILEIHEPGQTPAPHEGEVEIAVGIDLGTTHSVVAFAEGDEADRIVGRSFDRMN